MLRLQRGSRRSTEPSYLDLRDSIYCIPLASSMSEASFLLLLIASRISASTSSAFCVSVFFASGNY
jgi:hypothetical protein